MVRFICGTCGTSVKTYPGAHRIAQCRGCKQWYEVNRNNAFTITPLNSFNDKNSVPDSIREMKDKIVEYLDTKVHNTILFGPNDIYIIPSGRKRNPENTKLQSTLSAWMETWHGDWRIDGYSIKRHNDSKPFKYVAVRV